MAFDRIWSNPETTVILDSSAIIMLFEFSIDLDCELKRLVGKYKIIIPKQIINELIFLSNEGKGVKRQKAKVSLKLIEKYEVVDVFGKTGDDSVYNLAKKTKGAVVTNDRDLKKRLKEIPVSVIFLRAKKKLEVI